MSVPIHHERFVLSEGGLSSCHEILFCTENITDLSNLDDSELLNKTENSLILNCYFTKPFTIEKTCQITKKGIHLDFSYFCILMRELLDSKVFRYGFIKRWSFSETSLSRIDNAMVTKSFNSNDLSSSDMDIKTSAVLHYNLLIKEPKDNSSQYKVNESSIVTTNSAIKKLILTNQHSKSLQTVILHISGLVPVLLDRRWCGMLLMSVQERIQLDVSMSWLSTLGGACSALGDYSPDWASKAALISSQQMKLAWRIGDPHILARCRLYAAIALIQKGNLKAASSIIRREYDALRCQPDELRDRRLAKMCQGIWVKLLYTKKFGTLT